MDEVRDRRVLIAYIAAAVLALLAITGISLYAPAIETDLETRAAAALAAAGIANAAVSVDGRTVTLHGPARDEAARAAAVDAVEVFGVRNVIDAFGAPAPGTVAGGYLFGAVWNGQVLTLTGYMPTLDEQETLLAQTRDAFQGIKIVNDSRVAPNPPAENWSLAVTQAVRALRPLSNGVLKIEGTQISIGGNAPSEEARADAGMALAQIPEPFTALTDIDVTEPASGPVAASAYRFGAAWDGTRMALSGALPSNAAREAVKTALARVTLDDKTAIDNAAPDGAFADVVTALLTAIAAHADSATLDIEDRTITLGASSASEKEARALGAAIDDLPAAYGWTVTLAIAGQGPAAPNTKPTDTPAAKCQSAATAALGENPIVFASASSDLPETAEALVTKLAEIAATCPKARLEIAGHTDASGNAAKNLQLSEDRAAALEAALIVKGVDAARLTAKGYGASRPVAANDNDANKAKNRRIEVIVRP